MSLISNSNDTYVHQKTISKTKSPQRTRPSCTRSSVSSPENDENLLQEANSMKFFMFFHFKDLLLNIL